MGIAGQAKVDRRPEDCPTAWFAVLERARDVGDFARAAEAQRQLQRLGVRVKFLGRRPTGEEAARG